MTGESGWGGGRDSAIECGARALVRGHVRAALTKASTLDPNRLSESLSESLIRVRVAGLMKASMQAVAHLHSLGRIHRDIKVPIHTHTHAHAHAHAHAHPPPRHQGAPPTPPRPSVLARSPGAFACAVACFRVSRLSRDPPVT